MNDGDDELSSCTHVMHRPLNIVIYAVVLARKKQNRTMASNAFLVGGWEGNRAVLFFIVIRLMVFAFFLVEVGWRS